jgi:urease accessory protein
MTGLLLLLADGRFPGGGHAHSGGIEAAVASGDVHDLATLAVFLEGKVTTTGAVEAWAAAAVCAGADPAVVEAEYEARCPSPALRAAGRAQGRGLRRSAARSWPAVAATDAEQHAVVLGWVARAAGLSPDEAASLALHNILMGGAAAAVRLLSVDMADTAAVVAGLAPLADRIVRQTSPSLDFGAANGSEPRPGTILERFSGGPAWSAPALEVRAEDHARWEVRLFAS